MPLFCCVHALEQLISTLFSDKAIVPLNDLCDQLILSKDDWELISNWTQQYTIELWMEKKKYVRIEPFLCTFKIPQYNQWPISEYTIARPKEKKFINKPGWKGYKKEIMLIQALIWKWIDLNLWSNWQNYTVQWCPTAK